MHLILSMKQKNHDDTGDTSRHWKAYFQNRRAPLRLLDEEQNRSFDDTDGSAFIG